MSAQPSGHNLNYFVYANTAAKSSRLHGRREGIDRAAQILATYAATVTTPYTLTSSLWDVVTEIKNLPIDWDEVAVDEG